MKVGTKSVLFGAHCFLIHPVILFIAWWKLFGFPYSPKLWVAFFVHDLGYFGKPNMDGAEGVTHPELGAMIMHKLFDEKGTVVNIGRNQTIRTADKMEWHDFVLYHSRFYAKKYGKQPSKLCIADKLAICLEPTYFYLLRVNLSGEVTEYMKVAESRNLAGEPTNKYESMKLSTKKQVDWFRAVKSYIGRWVEEHKDGKEDTWTPETKQAINDDGVWK